MHFHEMRKFSSIWLSIRVSNIMPFSHSLGWNLQIVHIKNKQRKKKLTKYCVSRQTRNRPAEFVVPKRFQRFNKIYEYFLGCCCYCGAADCHEMRVEPNRGFKELKIRWQCDKNYG